jgi:AraC-like DNA-binding protein
MFDITCNGIPQDWKRGIVLLPDRAGDISYGHSQDLYNSFGCFSYHSFFIKSFTVSFHFYCTRQPVTLRVKQEQPVPEIFTTLVHPSTFLGMRPGYTQDYRLGFRFQPETTLDLEAGRQYAWCSIHLPMDAMPWRSMRTLEQYSRYATLMAWTKHGFQVLGPRLEGAALSAIREMFCYPEATDMWEGIQQELVSELGHHVVRGIADSVPDLGVANVSYKREHDIRHAAARLDAQLESPPEVKKLSRHVGTNQTTLRQGFKEVFNTGIRGYITNGRIALATRLLLTTEMTEKDIAEEAGYASTEALIKVFRKRFNKTPGYFRNLRRNVELDRNASSQSH